MFPEDDLLLRFVAIWDRQGKVTIFILSTLLFFFSVKVHNTKQYINVVQTHTQLIASNNTIYLNVKRYITSQIKKTKQLLIQHLVRFNQSRCSMIGWPNRNNNSIRLEPLTLPTLCCLENLVFSLRHTLSMHPW